MDNDRRQFFRRIAGKTSQTIVKELDNRVSEKARHWIRPPYAKQELDFLLQCTRCHDCIRACTYQVIFPLPGRLGADVAGTPALDLLNKGCHLCTDWPCVQACQPKALIQIVSETAPSAPKLAIASINQEMCLPYLGPECGACASSCPVPDALQWTHAKPTINPDRCTGCALCRTACITQPNAINIESLYSVDSSLPSI